jgi:diphthamide biosynthesis protein 3
MFEYEEVPLDELTYDAENQRLQYPCPCGDLFEMAVDDLLNGKDIAQCPTCSLTVKVLFTSDSRLAFLAKHGIAGNPSEIAAEAITA